MCQICFCEFDNSDPEYMADQLSCGHQFMVCSWKGYLKNKVKEEGQRSVFAKCPQPRCNVVVPHSYFLKYLRDEEEKEDGINYQKKYLSWHCKQFTDQNKDLRWCPAKGCDLIVERSQFQYTKSVYCTCGHGFCFKCMLEDHAPTSCDQIKLWLEKEKSDSENLQWFKANTKPCPKCNTLIEKNQGCNHIICSKCSHGFCWLCLTDWSKHGSKTGGYYACNVYEKLKSADK